MTEKVTLSKFEVHKTKKNGILSDGITNPVVNNLHLCICMEPVFSILHYSERCANLIGTFGYSIYGS